MKQLLILVVFFTGFTTWAEVQPLIAIKSSYPEGYLANLDLHLDERGNILGARYRMGKSWGIDYTLHDIHQGLNLVEIDHLGIKVITLTGKTVDAKSGGPIQVKFRRNLITGDERILRFQLRPLAKKSSSRAFVITSDDVGAELEATPIDSLAIGIRKVLGIPTVVNSMTLSNHGKVVHSIDTSDLPNWFYFW